MTTLTIALSTEQFQGLQTRARVLGISPEALVQASVEALITRPLPTFDQAVRYVLQKNADLYRRLA